MGGASQATRKTAIGAWLALGVFAGLACAPTSHWRSLREELARLSAARRPAELPAGWMDLRSAIHVHSFISHDSEGSHQELVQGALEADLDVVVMTEHDTPEIFTHGLRGWRDGVLFIQGMEIIKGCRGMADRCATLLAIGLESYFDHRALGVQETVDEIRAQGALPFIAHPRGWRDWSVEGIAGIEIYDILDDALDRKWMFPKYFADVLYSYEDYPEEVFLQIQDRPDWHLRKWDELTRGAAVVGIAGNDAHRNVNVLGRQLDPYALSFRFVTTHLLSWAHDEEAVLTALSAGHAYVAFDRLADATGFWFATTDAAEPAIQGDEVAFRPGLELAARTPLPARIRLLRDGEPADECRCRELLWEVKEPGVYRVEVFLSVGGEWRPWIFSNPIYVR